MMAWQRFSSGNRILWVAVYVLVDCRSLAAIRCLHISILLKQISIFVKSISPCPNHKVNYALSFFQNTLPLTLQKDTTNNQMAINLFQNSCLCFHVHQCPQLFYAWVWANYVVEVVCLLRDCRQLVRQLCYGLVDVSFLINELVANFTQVFLGGQEYKISELVNPPLQISPSLHMYLYLMGNSLGGNALLYIPELFAHMVVIKPTTDITFVHHLKFLECFFIIIDLYLHVTCQVVNIFQVGVYAKSHITKILTEELYLFTEAISDVGHYIQVGLQYYLYDVIIIQINIAQIQEPN